MRATFENTYQTLPESFYARAEPRRASAPELIAWNEQLAEFLNLESGDKAELAEIFSGNKIPAGASPIAQVYAGHQFGNFVPRLGDGRAILLGEVRAKNGQLFDVQLKGAGPTPYSRRGDGLAALGPVLREYLVSEYMSQLSVPTTRALAFCTTGDKVRREEILPGAVLTRIAASHVRVGTFEYFYAQEDRPALEKLLHFCVDRHYPHLVRDTELPIHFLEAVLRAQADLIAQWMALGFIHGVMNTDNSSVAGITIDYGPCAFMDTFRIDQVYSYIDSMGRYAFGNQPRIAYWNLIRLAECLAPLCTDNPEAAIEKINQTLATFSDRFAEAWCQRLGTKLGMQNSTIKDRELIELWFNYLQTAKLDFTLSFRRVAELISSDDSSFFPAIPEREQFLSLWRPRVDPQSALALDRINPLYIPRNHLVERAIKEANEGDFSFFYRLQSVLENPYVEQSGQELFATPPLLTEIVENTFCGT